MSHVQNPHFSFPFKLASHGRSVLVNEQDTEEDITDCVEVLLRTERGTRIEVPDYGVEDLTFTADLDHDKHAELVAAIHEWEPRALATVESRWSTFDDLLHYLRVTIQGRQNA